jgi:hypothetical protein
MLILEDQPQPETFNNPNMQRKLNMDPIQIIIVLAIICMIGGAGIIFGSGVQPAKKTKVIKVVDATPIAYEPFSIDTSTGIVEMAVPKRKTKQISYKL